MLFWLTAALLTLCVTLLTVRPLFRRVEQASPARGEHDAEVYRAQLRELEHDAERGAISASDAAVARAEIARRLLRASAEVDDGSPVPRRRVSASALAGLAVALALPVSTFLFYDRAGSPETSDLPLASRDLEREAVPDLDLMMARIEQRLAAEPDDGAGWAVAAPVYLRLGEGEKAATAFRNAIRLNGESAQALAGLGEALVQSAEGEVTPEAEAVFRQSLAFDPTWPPARFFLALNLSQENRPREAALAWDDLLRTGPPDAPWRPIAEAARADAQAASTPVAAERGPDAAAVAAAANLPPDERQAMVDGMVSQLSSRLQTAPNDVEGWKRLIRSYAVLQNEAEALAARDRALDVFAAGSRERDEIAGFARELGLPTGTTTVP